MIITVNDVRATGFCLNGLRRWARLHGFDLADFLKNGIESERVLATGDALAQKIVETAIAMRARDHG